MKESKSRFDGLGDRMKMYEMREAGRKAMPGVPVIARLDGRAFHSFTRGMPRPFYLPMTLAMIDTAKYLVEQSHASLGYTQSDEITLVFLNENVEEMAFFAGRIQKLVSVLASMATVKFSEEVCKSMPDRAKKHPVFDCRVWEVPNVAVAFETVYWRVLDCMKNAVTMAASAHYSHKELHGKNSRTKREMLLAKGDVWEDYPLYFREGVFIRRRTVMKELSEKELARIPPDRRPAGPVPRSEVVPMDLPSVRSIENLKEVVFYGAEPSRMSRDTTDAPVDR